MNNVFARSISVLAIVFFNTINAYSQEDYNNIHVLDRAFAHREAKDSTVFFQSDAKGTGLATWYIDNSDVDALIKMLTDEYKQINESKQINNINLDYRDKEIIRTLKKNLNSYYMHIPKLEYMKSYSCTLSRTGVYEIAGWNTVKLDDAHIDKFMRLFLAGAHFVILGDNNLLPEVAALPDAAKNWKHSHYRQTDQRMIYPSITWRTRKPAPIISALLVDFIMDKAHNSIGTFFQLEGWPTHHKSNFKDNYYHAGDFWEHFKTVWNISTYGMSPYSEKRGTSIFLTKNPQPPKIETITPTFKKNYSKYAVEARS